MAKKTKDGRYEYGYELSLDNLPEELVEKIVSGNVFYDPVFDVVATLQDLEWFSDSLTHEDYDRATALVESCGDSTVINRFWELHALYSGQWIIKKRLEDRKHYERVLRVKQKRSRGAQAIGAKKSCSALRLDRSRCTNEARYVYARKYRNSWSYQRRCEGCFVKVKDKAKYRLLNDGRYFKGGLHRHE